MYLDIAFEYTEARAMYKAFENVHHVHLYNWFRMVTCTNNGVADMVSVIFVFFIILLIDNRQETRGVIWRLVFNSIHQRSTFLIIFMQMKWHKLVLNFVNTFKNSINWIQQSTQFGFLLFCWQLHWVQRTVLLFAQPRGPVRTKKKQPRDRQNVSIRLIYAYLFSIH